MSPTASDSNEPKSAIPSKQRPPEFDLLAFWIQYRKLVIRLFSVALLAVAAWGAWLFMDYRRRAGSETALANAKTAADYRKMSADWSGTPAAGTAQVRLAEELRKEGKAAEAAQALREFVEKYPVHPLRAPAAHALAASLETAGKMDEALLAYQQFASTHGRSRFAPLGFIGQARVLAALHRTEEAQKVLESVEQSFPGNPFVEDARTLLEEIKNPAGRKTGGSPRPTPPTPEIPKDATPAPALKLEETPPPPALKLEGTPPPPALKLEGATPAPQPPAAPAAPALKVDGTSTAPQPAPPPPTPPTPNAVTPAVPAPTAPAPVVPPVPPTPPAPAPAK